ncbi:MAG: DnaB-like helicase C-terminal domain-containing protein [Gemmatimonas sp.]
MNSNASRGYWPDDASPVDRVLIVNQSVSHHDISPLTRVVARVDRLRDGEVHPAIISTGFPSVDRALGGGIRRGDLIVLGGDDGVGSSALALAMALRIQPLTLLLTSEMHAERAFERAVAMSARVSLDALRLGVVSDEERVRLASAAVALRDRAPVIDTLGDGGMDAVERAADASPAPAVLIVDGLEALLSRDHSRFQPRDEALAYAVLSLKRLALARDAAVVCLAHLPALDRHRHDRRPRLTDFGVRGAVGTHADVVLGLYREDLYDADLGVAGATELRVLKHRDGALAYVDLFFYAKWLRFEDVAEV